MASPRGGERGGRSAGLLGQRPVASDPCPQRLHPRLALGALPHGRLGHAALGTDLGGELRPAHGVGALVGRLAPALHQPVGPAHRLGGLLDLAQRPAQRDVGLLALRRRRRSRARRRRPAPRGPRPRPRRRPRTRRPARRGGCAARAPAPRPPAGAWRSSPAPGQPDPARAGVTAIPWKSRGTVSRDSTTQAPASSDSATRRGVAGRAHAVEQPLGAGAGRLGGRCLAAAPDTITSPPSSPAESSAASPAATLSTTPAPSRGPSAAASASS